MKKLILIISILLSIFSISAVGFHSASEILPGQFATGDFSFDGNVGINSLTPTGQLFIYKNDTDGDGQNEGGVTFIKDHTPNLASGSSTNGLIFKIENSEGILKSGAGIYGGLNEVLNGSEIGVLKFYTGDGILTERMVIDGNGNIGIGTNSPDDDLDINDIIRINGNQGEFASIGNMNFVIDSDNDSTSKIFRFNKDGRYSKGESPTTLMVIQEGGNVGIGTDSPGRKLEIRDIAARISLYSNTGESSIVDLGDIDDRDIGRIEYDNGNDNMYFRTNALDRVIIKSDGNVGIGNSNPLVKLDVEGTAECDGAGCWGIESDISYKYNITNLNYGLNEILLIQPRRYNLKSNNLSEIGVIAQELELIIPELVHGETGFKNVGYGSLTPVLVNAIQDQQKLIQDLQSEQFLSIEKSSIQQIQLEEQNFQIELLKQENDNLKLINSNFENRLIELEEKSK